MKNSKKNFYQDKRFITLYISYVLGILIKQRFSYSPIILSAPVFKNIFQVHRTDAVSPRSIFQWFYQFSSVFQPFI